VLKNIGTELSSYHGRSLNGKDIKKVMNNFPYDFKEGKRDDCLLLDAEIKSLCSCIFVRCLFCGFYGTEHCFGTNCKPNGIRFNNLPKVCSGSGRGE
jgi:hypothetical protein